MARRRAEDPSRKQHLSDSWLHRPQLHQQLESGVHERWHEQVCQRMSQCVQVGSGSGTVGEGFSVKISGSKDGGRASLHLWSPDSPYLYDLDVTLSLPGNSQVRQCGL